MITILRTAEFGDWLRELKDANARARIVNRIHSAERGNFGDCSSVGGGVSEMRFHFGPGYRVYFTRTGDVVYLLLCGGAKQSQSRDIKRAHEMVRILQGEQKRN